MFLTTWRRARACWRRFAPPTRRTAATSYAADVGYDIYFRYETAEHIQDAGEAPDELPPLQLTPEQDAWWQRFMARVQADIGPIDADPEQLHTYRGGAQNHLEFWLQQPAMQVWYTGDFVAIEMPYWYTATADQAMAAMRVLCKLASLVQDETGMQAFDPQIDQPFTVDHLEEAAARYRWFGEHVRAVEKARGAEHDRTSDTGAPAASE